MPRFNVEHNGQWACFSSVSDGFVTRFMDPAHYDSWRRAEYGRAGYRPIEEANRMDLSDVVRAVFLNRSRRAGLAELESAGLSPEDIASLMQKKDSE